MASQCELNELPGIDQMLRPEMFRRPTAAVLKLYPEEVSPVAKNAVTHRADKLAVTVVDGNVSTWQDRALDLQAYSGDRNVFQVGDPAAVYSPVIDPDGFDELGAKEPVVRSPFLILLHVLLIGVSRAVRMRLSRRRYQDETGGTRVRLAKAISI
jgi:hypothetical protein